MYTGFVFSKPPEDCTRFSKPTLQYHPWLWRAEKQGLSDLVGGKVNWKMSIKMIAAPSQQLHW